MFLKTVILLLVGCLPEGADANRIVVSPTAGGVEVRVGDYVMTGGRVSIDRKGQVVTVEGAAKAPARVEAEGGRMVQHGRLITVDLARGTFRVVDGFGGTIIRK
jgi:hypothetical protein